MRALSRPLQIIRADLRTYVLVNVAVYGTFLVGMVLGLAFPDLHAARTTTFADSASADLATTVVRTPWLFALTIFVVNVLPTAGFLITLPSLVVPFAGLAVFAVKILDLGISLAPVDRAAALTMVPHSLTVLIEFQAYALVAFGAYLLGRSWMRPASVGAATRRESYAVGLRLLAWLWLPALALFVVGAVYEALEIYLLVPRLIGA